MAAHGEDVVDDFDMVGAAILVEVGPGGRRGFRGDFGGTRICGVRGQRSRALRWVLVTILAGGDRSPRQSEYPYPDCGADESERASAERWMSLHCSRLSNG